MAVIVPFTTNLKAATASFSTVVQPNSRNGLVSQSVALIGQIRATDKKRLIRPLGLLDPTDLTAIDTQLKAMLQL